MKSDILSVVEAKRTVYFLTADYEEGDIGHSVGTVYKVSASRDEGELPEKVLSSNETLSKLWLSPQGSLSRVRTTVLRQPRRPPSTARAAAAAAASTT